MVRVPFVRTGVGRGVRTCLRTVLVVLTASLLAVSTATGPPAWSAGPDDPRAGFVDAPASVPVGWDGVLTVAWLNYDDTQEFSVEVTGPGLAFAERFTIPEATSVRREVRVGPIDATGAYTAVFRDALGGVVFSHDFRVVEPLDLVVGEASPPTFLPLVRDGIDDGTRTTYRVSRAASVTARVLDAAGRTVHEADLGERAPGVDHTWTWTGDTRDGARLERGRYTLQLVATADGLTSAGATSARVASYRVPVPRAVRRPGVRTDRRDPGACRVAPAGRGALDVDCQGAPYRSPGARLTWRFHPDASADRLRTAVRGDGFSERPDGALRVTRRRDGDAVLVTVRVLPGSSYRIEAVGLRYRVQRLR